jgi:hypothetical protein
VLADPAATGPEAEFATFGGPCGSPPHPVIEQARTVTANTISTHLMADSISGNN